MHTLHGNDALRIVGSALLLCSGLAGCGGGGTGDDSSSQTRYAITDLGAGREASSINLSGQVVGWDDQHAFLWNNGTLTDLGTLGGDRSAAVGINDAGQVVGTANLQPGNRQIARGFLWHDGVMTALGVLPGHDASEAISINAFGHAVGYSHSATGAYPVIWRNGTMTRLSGLTGMTDGYAEGINAAGLVVGGAMIGGVEHAWLWRNGTMTDLGDHTGTIDSEAHAINQSGTVVGEYGGGATPLRAVLWQNERMTSLGVLPGAGGGQSAQSCANGINSAGLVVGWSGPFPVIQVENEPVTTHAFVYGSGAIKDLNALVPSGSGWVLTEANGINDRGQIVGCGVYQGKWHAFLLTPQ